MSQSWMATNLNSCHDGNGIISLHVLFYSSFLSLVLRFIGNCEIAEHELRRFGLSTSSHRLSSARKRRSRRDVNHFQGQPYASHYT